MDKVKVKIINKSNNGTPKYETEGSAGMDIRAYITEKTSNIGTHNTIIIQPGARILIPTGLFVKISEGWQFEVRSRSGLAYKQGVFVLNSPGTIDSDYTGEIGVILQNDGKFPFTVTNGDRIAQLVLMPAIQAQFVKVDTLDETERGDGGFGSTGVK